MKTSKCPKCGSEPRRDAVMPMKFSDYAGRYRGITYPQPPFVGWPKWFYSLWRRFMCRREQHLFDEVLSSGGRPYHYLVCDACQLMVAIEGIDETYVQARDIAPSGDSSEL